jgi:hypothetical protein
MSPEVLVSESAPRASGTVRRGYTTRSLGTVNQRLAIAERELRIQFTRIAQLQAQVDVLLGALPHSPGRQSRTTTARSELFTFREPL